MAREDTFSALARYYDALMSHVDYTRWETIATELTTHLPRGFRHLDAACGTARFLDGCLRAGWDSSGVDLSIGMLHAARLRTAAPLAAADLRALPFREGFDFITCLFDSVNFILDDEGIPEAMAAFATALRPGGVLYFDIVTERMVTEYFEGPAWTEDNEGFHTTWKTDYDRATNIAETRVRVNHGEASTIRERIYPREAIEDALAAAGLRLIICADAETWNPPRRNTIRLDFVACKPPIGKLTAKRLTAQIKERLR